MVRFLNLLAHNKISLETFHAEMIRLEGKAYDPKQIKVLQSISKIAPELTQPSSN